MALKYLKNTKINLNNVFIITGNFNIRNNDWNPVYPHHSIHVDTLRLIANSFNLELFIPVTQISTRYTDNIRDLNSVIDLMFLQTNSEEFDTHIILPNL